MFKHKQINLAQTIENFINGKQIFIQGKESCYELKPTQGEKGILEIIAYSEDGTVFLEERM